MQLLNLVLPVILLRAAELSAIPQEGAIEPRHNRESYTLLGLSNGKRAILNDSGHTLEIAIAMLESKRMPRVYGSRAGFAGQSQIEWNNGVKLNSGIYADMASRWDYQNYYGYNVYHDLHKLIVAIAGNA
ncbi:hypothetical protein B0I35DRAFT_512737 [Stachybotrys elegans]|uniref:Uncharacterized protein n=1 Tax=Stachybotrys elegans TaxID=80388 RepID=A0A8K0WQ48_9HYPO|nr:hypothetical protein B0I35DRAFT_512737 [Stachybotrys elegans]